MSSSSLTSTAVSLTSDFFMKNFYRYNRTVIKASARENYTKAELTYEDSRALKRAAAKLSSFDYSSEENGDNIANTIKAFTETYNYTMDSTSSVNSESYRQHRQLKALTDKYGDALEDIGITIEDDGKLSLNEDLLKKSTFKELHEIFSDDSDYVQNIRKIARRINSTSYDEVYAQMTGCGGRLSITL